MGAWLEDPPTLNEVNAVASLLDRMRKQWDAIATRNAFYGVVSWPEFQALDLVDRE